VIGYSLIPYENSASFIADPTREVLSFGDVIKKKLENTVGLFLIESDDFLRVDWVDI
jgi:hypothetical protein